MKLLLSLLIPIILLSACSIDWNSESHDTVKQEDNVVKTKCESNEDWEHFANCYETDTYCGENNNCTAPIITINCGEQFQVEGEYKCECKTESGVTYSRKACK